MKPTDIQLIRSLSNQEPELSRLFERHLEYEKRLGEIGRSKWQSPEDYYEQKQLKRLKLSGRDRIESILARHRSQASAAV